MLKTNLTAMAWRLCSSVFLVFSINSIPVHAAPIVVDGNLADIIGIVGTNNDVNIGYGDDPLGSTEGTESNNGFDIDKVYAYYYGSTDTLFLGLSVYGTVGNSSAVGAAGTTEGIANANCGSGSSTGSNSRSIFDCNETYGIQLYNGTSTSDPQLILFNVSGTNTGGDYISTISNPNSFTYAYAVSEANNGVEFSITGLYASGLLTNPPNDSTYPSDLLVRFSAGSGDTSGTTTLGEDSHLLQMQAVPIPAAVWLFGSGLAGLFGVTRKRRNKT
jgi:hypothetical protein